MFIIELISSIDILLNDVKKKIKKIIKEIYDNNPDSKIREKNDNIGYTKNLEESIFFI